jgi:serine phosphatase RsbU (regulator of sigma subunit)
VGSALITAMAHACCVNVASIAHDDKSSTLSPATLLRRLNTTLWTSLKGNYSMTFFAALIDLNRGVLRCSNAGHNFPILISPAAVGAESEGTAARTHRKLIIRANPAGNEENAEYADHEYPISAGDKLVLYTDGLIEGVSPEGKQWGGLAFNNCVKRHITSTGDELLAAIVSEATTHYNNHPLADDFTLVIADIARDWQRRNP